MPAEELSRRVGQNCSAAESKDTRSWLSELRRDDLGFDAPKLCLAVLSEELGDGAVPTNKHYVAIDELNAEFLRDAPTEARLSRGHGPDEDDRAFGQPVAPAATAPAPAPLRDALICPVFRLLPRTGFAGLISTGLISARRSASARRRAPGRLAATVPLTLPLRLASLVPLAGVFLACCVLALNRLA